MFASSRSSFDAAALHAPSARKSSRNARIYQRACWMLRQGAWPQAVQQNTAVGLLFNHF